MKRTFRMLLSALLALGLLHGDVRGQELGRAALGGAVGVAGGVGVTIAIIVARARLANEYIHEAGDLVHWQSAPMIAGPTTGVAFGLMGEDELRGSVIGAVSGLVVGTALGAGGAWLSTDDTSWHWAAAAMGGGAGIALGALVGGLIAWSQGPDDRGDTPALIGVRIPLP